MANNYKLKGDSFRSYIEKEEDEEEEEEEEEQENEEQAQTHENSESSTSKYNLCLGLKQPVHIKQGLIVNRDYSYEKIHKGKNAYHHGLIYLAIFFLIVGCAFTQIYFFKNENTDKSIDIKQELMHLKQKFPNQNYLLWQNVLKVMSSFGSPIQTLTLVYKKSDNKSSDIVAECLAKDLGQIINKKFNKDNNLSIYQHKEVTDYGELLTFYRNIVRTTKHLIVLNLHEIPGETAKFFHFLCDETVSDLKPSFFIFTLQDSSKEEGKSNRFLQRVGDILRNAWNDLLENELTPLIVRVVRNVAEISPENINGCS